MATNYPNDYDSFPLPNSTDKTAGSGKNHAELHRDVGDSIEAIEATLGLRPMGPYTTVEERLDAIEAGAISIDAGDLDISVTADDVTVIDAGGYWSGSNVEQILQEIGAIDFTGAVSSVNNEIGDVVIDAGDIDVVDSGGYWAGTTVEAILQEIGAAGLGGVVSVNGETGTVVIDAGDIDIIDEDDLFVSTTVEDTLIELYDRASQEVVQIEIYGNGEYIVADDDIVSFRMPWAANLTDVRAYVKGVSLDGPIVIQVFDGNYSGLLSPLLTIDEGEYTSVTAATPTVPDVYLEDDELIRFDVLSAGSMAIGPLVVTLYFTRSDQAPLM